MDTENERHKQKDNFFRTIRLLQETVDVFFTLLNDRDISIPFELNYQDIDGIFCLATTPILEGSILLAETTKAFPDELQLCWKGLQTVRDTVLTHKNHMLSQHEYEFCIANIEQTQNVCIKKYSKSKEILQSTKYLFWGDYLQRWADCETVMALITGKCLPFFVVVI